MEIPENRLIESQELIETILTSAFEVSNDSSFDDLIKACDQISLSRGDRIDD